MNKDMNTEARGLIGLWAHEMSQEFPNASVIGLDLTPPAKHHRLKVEGLLYVQGDVHNQLEFMSNAFDFVYQRDMATVIPLGRWIQLIQEFYRVLKPGGWLQLVEYGKIQRIRLERILCLTNG
jgi:ubiquinone/menaquinone biosynthesis C-methylase UbiE